MPESRAGGGDAVAGDDHLAVVHFHPGVPGPEGRQPPGRRGAQSVQDSRLGQEEGSRARRRDGRAAVTGTRDEVADGKGRVAADILEQGRRLVSRKCRNDQQIRRLRVLKRLGFQEESGPGPDLRGGADHRHVPGGRFVDLSAQRVGVVQHVEDGRQPRVEHPVVDDDRYSHDGNSTKHAVSAGGLALAPSRPMASGQQARYDEGAGDRPPIPATCRIPASERAARAPAVSAAASHGTRMTTTRTANGR